MFVADQILIDPVDTAAHPSIVANALGATAFIGPFYIGRSLIVNNPYVYNSFTSTSSTISLAQTVKRPIVSSFIDVTIHNTHVSLVQTALSNITLDTTNITVDLTVSSFSAAPKAGDVAVLYTTSASWATLVTSVWQTTSGGGTPIYRCTLQGPIPNNITGPLTVYIARNIGVKQLSSGFVSVTPAAPPADVTVSIVRPSFLYEGALLPVVGIGNIETNSVPFAVTQVNIIYHVYDIEYIVTNEPIVLSNQPLTEIFNITTQELENTEIGIIGALKQFYTNKPITPSNPAYVFIVEDGDANNSVPAQNYVNGLRKLCAADSTLSQICLLAKRFDIVFNVANELKTITTQTTVRARLWSLLPGYETIQTVATASSGVTVNATNNTVSATSLFANAQVGDTLSINYSGNVVTYLIAQINNANSAVIVGTTIIGGSNLSASVKRKRSPDNIISLVASIVNQLPRSPYILYVLPVPLIDKSSLRAIDSITLLPRLARIRRQIFGGVQMLYHKVNNVIIDESNPQYSYTQIKALAELGIFVIAQTASKNVYIAAPRTSTLSSITFSNEGVGWLVSLIQRIMYHALYPMLTKNQRVAQLQMYLLAAANKVLSQLTQIVENDTPFVSSARVSSISYDPATPNIIHITIALSTPAFVVDTIDIALEFTNE